MYIKISDRCGFTRAIMKMKPEDYGSLPITILLIESHGFMPLIVWE